MNYKCILAVVAMGITVSGCGIIPLWASIAHTIGDGVLTVETGKSSSEHALSILTGEDCQFIRVIDGQDICMAKKTYVDYLISLDCDIYTSTVEVLKFLVENDLFCDGSILLYDDWGAYRSSGLSEDYEYKVGEARAHKEMIEKYNLNFELVHKEVIDPSFYIMTVFKFRGKL